MYKMKSLVTPVSVIIDLNDNRYKLQESSKAHLRTLTLAELVYLTSDFRISKYINHVGKIKLALLYTGIKETEEYKHVETILYNEWL